MQYGCCLCDKKFTSLNERFWHNVYEHPQLLTADRYRRLHVIH